MILVQTPLRVSLFGGGSDYPEWFMEHQGAVLGMAIDQHTYVGIQSMHPGQEMRYRIQYGIIDNCQTVGEIKHPAIRAALQYYRIDEPLEFHCFGEMPGRAGLGSSSSFCVGVLMALQEYFDLSRTTGLNLASEAISFERHVIPETVGFQDQIFAAVGGINFITFDRSGSCIQRLHLSRERIEELEQSLILVYTGSMRDAHSMAEKQIAAIPRNQSAVADLVKMAREGKEILENPKQSLIHLGQLLDEAWRTKILLCPEVTNPVIDLLYSRGMECGAAGGKLLGAGAGGFILFFVPPEKREEFKAQIGNSHKQFKISDMGARKINL